MNNLLKNTFLLILVFSFTSCCKSCCTDQLGFKDDYTLIDKYEDGEENLTDDLSVFASNNNAFGKEIPGLSSFDKIRFASGNALFNQSWVPAPASTSSLDGLGPVFNSRACASCHFKDGRGKPDVQSQFGSKGFLMRLSIPGEDEHGGPKPHPDYGDQLQDHSILNVPREGRVKVDYTIISEKYPDGTTYELRKPTYTMYELNFGNLDGVMTSARVGTQTIGLGLVDAIPVEEILKNEDITDIDKDGISGKANYVWNIEKQALTIGKFGWKANMPTLKQQIAGAFHGDMGLSTSMISSNDCPSPQNDCNNVPNGGDPEITDKQLDRVLLYQSSLAVPKRRRFKEKNVLKGKVLFNSLNCVGCHKTDFTTGSYSFNTLVENKKVSPFSDFLLHDMGEGLADNRPDFLADGREWRTQPLWGIGLIKTVNKHTFFLHDGRARNVEEAILWHGGEAEQVLDKFKKLSKTKRSQVIEYVKSL